MAVAVRQSVDPSYLLQRVQWQAQGWSQIRSGIIRQVPGDQNGVPLVALQLDAFEWVDVQAFGIGNTDTALDQLRAHIQSRGSDLYAFAMYRREVVNIFGIHAWSYRLVLLHSLVQLLEAAVLILAIAFAAIIFIQYVTTGHSPALQDLQQAWNGVVSSAGQAVGTAAGDLAQPLIWGTIFLGVGAIAFASASKGAGVKARQPSTSVGVKAGPVSSRVGS